MDSLTHIALGAVIGEAYAGKALGRKAMLVGAAAQSFPDIDFVLGFFNSPVDDLLAHRGITHSIVFSIAATFVLAYVMKRLVKTDNPGFTIRHWMIFLGMEIAMHLTLDCLNAYGTGLFEPFTNDRIAFNVIFVADPLFTIWSLICVITLLFMRVDNPLRKKITYATLILSACYMTMSIINKSIIESRATKSFSSAGLSPRRHFTSPTPLNTLLWYVVAESDSGFNIGYSSVFDSNKSIEFDFYPQNNHLLTGINGTDEVEKLKLFAQGYYTLEEMDSAVVLNDLRFGQIGGWHTRHAPFVFYFFLDKPDRNSLVVQRGRFAGWNRQTLGSFWKRIKGNRD